MVRVGMPSREAVFRAAQNAAVGACKLTKVAVKIADVAAVAVLSHLVGKQAYPGKCPIDLPEKWSFTHLTDSMSPAAFAFEMYGCARLAMFVFSNTFGKAEAPKEKTVAADESSSTQRGARGRSRSQSRSRQAAAAATTVVTKKT